MSNVVSVLAVIKFLGATSGVARAQATGTISGIVTDEPGASIPGVTIEVTNAGTNQTRTGATGTYTVFQVPPGPYVVKAMLPGCKVVVRDGITVTVESTVRVDIRTSVGGRKESVTGTADSRRGWPHRAACGEVQFLECSGAAGTSPAAGAAGAAAGATA